MVTLRVGLLAAFVGTSAVGCGAIYAFSVPDENPAYCTVFNHMVKSAGTSVKDQLMITARSSGQLRPGVCTADDLTASASCLNAVYNSSVIMGYGELLRSPLKNVGRDCDFFTVMRHPIDRLVSAFFYCPIDRDVQHRPPEMCGNAESDIPATSRLVSFAAKNWGNKASVQMMLSFRCPAWGSHICTPPEDEYREFRYDLPATALLTDRGLKLMKEIEALLESYTAVGIAEEWGLTMKLFDATIKSPVAHWDTGVVHNRGQESLGRRGVLDWAHESPEIRSILSADLMLYDIAVRIFKRQTHEVLGTEWA